jgi:DNA polymerase-3 subunit delta'
MAERKRSVDRNAEHAPQVLMPSFPAWFKASAQQWLAQSERLAHAWLIQGPEGIGKLMFAEAAAAALLCEQPGTSGACGQCASCHWMALRQHPDLLRLRPDALALAEGQGDEVTEADGGSRTKPSQELRIDQIRAIEGWATLSAHRGGRRVVLLYPADALNTAAANALLKILEEPPAGLVFFLISHAPERLLPTVISRCRRWVLSRPDAAMALDWLRQQGVSQPEARLALAGGAPLLAWRDHQLGQPLVPAWLDLLAKALASPAALPAASLADAMSDVRPELWLDLLQRLAFDALTQQLGRTPRYLPSLGEQSAAWGRHCGAARMSDVLALLGKERAIARHPLNARLFATDLLSRLKPSPP